VKRILLSLGGVLLGLVLSASAARAFHPYGPPFYPRVFVGFDYYAHPNYFTHGPHFGPRPFPIVGPRYRMGYSGPVRRG
jgi:hypothetical protein